MSDQGSYNWANAKQASPFQSNGNYASGNSRGTGGGRPQMAPARMNGPAPQSTPMSGIFAQNPGAAQGLARGLRPAGPTMSTGQVPSGPPPQRRPISDPVQSRRADLGATMRQAQGQALLDRANAQRAYQPPPGGSPMSGMAIPRPPVAG